MPELNDAERLAIFREFATDVKRISERIPEAHEELTKAFEKMSSSARNIMERETE